MSLWCDVAEEVEEQMIVHGAFCGQWEWKGATAVLGIPRVRTDFEFFCI